MAKANRKRKGKPAAEQAIRDLPPKQDAKGGLIALLNQPSITDGTSNVTDGTSNTLMGSLLPAVQKVKY